MRISFEYYITHMYFPPFILKSQNPLTRARTKLKAILSLMSLILIPSLFPSPALQPYPSPSYPPPPHLGFCCPWPFVLKPPTLLFGLAYPPTVS
jgi:hypothetical protein